MIDEAASALYFRWQPPGKAFAVSLNLTTMERLGLAVRQEPDSGSARRREIGGFLLGATRRIRGVTVVEVDGFEPVECEHAFGASYFLSGDDQRRFTERLRYRNTSRDTSVIGFFRSNTRKEFAPVVEDLDLMAAYFSKASMVLLLVHSDSDGSLRGAFSLWRQRPIRTVTPYPDFPFDTGALQAGPYEICGPAREAAKKTRRAAEEAQRHEGRDWTPLRDTAAGLLRWPAGLMASYRSKRSQAPIPAVDIPAAAGPKMFALLRLAQQKAAHAAQSHLPSVFPGHFRLEWLVAGTVLATAVLGSIVYRGNRPNDAPRSITPQLSRPAERAVGEADRGQAPALPVSVAELPTEPPPQPGAIPVLVVPSPRPSPAVRPGRKAPRTRTRTASTQARVRFTPAVAKAAAAPTPLPAAPAVAQALPQAAAPLLELREPLTPEPTVRDPFVSVTVDPVPNGHRNLMGRLFATRKVPAGPAFVPPHLLQEPSLEVPSALRAHIREAVPVTVKLYVDRTGHVQYAELLTDGTGANREVASLAIFASRKWQFAPAQQEGGAVPAEVLVRFRFGATADR
jgi:TonB family protein